MRRIHPAKLAIVARGETQTHVARAIGYRLATLNQALNGEARASGPLKAKLAEYLGLPAGDLFDEDDPE